MHLILHILGLDTQTSSYYLFWSGIGSDLSEFAIIGAVIHQFRRLHRQKANHHIEYMEALTKLTEVSND